MKRFQASQLLLTTLILPVVLSVSNVRAENSPSNQKPVAKLLFSGVNDVQFINQEEQRFLGSGFVLEHQGRFYGVTAKHVLLMKKSGPPASTDIQSQLKHWKLRDPRAEIGSKPLVFGRLLNGDAKEAVTPQVLATDYLVFELPDAGNYQAIRLATHDPKPGDILHSIGCTYKTEKTCSQDIYTGAFLGKKEVNLLIDAGDVDLRSMFGLSGAPVLNQNNELVGVVSQFMPDAAGKERNAPIDTGYLRELLRKYAKPQ